MKTLMVGVAVLALFAAVGSASADDTTPQTPPTQQTGQQQQPQQAQQTQAAQTKDPLDEIECRKETITGSRLGAKKICKTKREWLQIQRDSQTATQKIQDKGGYNNPTSGSGN